MANKEIVIDVVSEYSDHASSTANREECRESITRDGQAWKEACKAKIRT